MKAYSEKSDTILRELLKKHQLTWDQLEALTGVKIDDPLLTVLKDNKQLIDFTDKKVFLTDKGREFITTTSFVALRDNKYSPKTPY